MSELLQRLGSYEPWTAADLPDDDRRWELVDGVPVVSAAPSVRHGQTVTALVEVVRSATAPHRILQNVGVGLQEVDHRVPDLVVLKADADVRALPRLRPEHVELAVEVVSPSSLTTDRITKPAQYAAWGIGAFWRVETDPLSLTAHVLRSGAVEYTDVGSWSAEQTVRLTEPFALTFALHRLLS